MPTAFRLLACGKANDGALDTRAKPKLSIVSLPAGSTAIGLSSRFAAVAFRRPMAFCQILHPPRCLTKLADLQKDNLGNVVLPWETSMEHLSSFEKMPFPAVPVVNAGVGIGESLSDFIFIILEHLFDAAQELVLREDPQDW